MKRFFIFLFSILFVLPVGAQKVGLVLSGGGAKGMAHIGVIKVLEDHGIPIDYVAGTSIGAIIAGLYAAGYSPEEMYDLFSSNEFRLWSTGRLDKEDLYYFKGKDESPDWIKLDVTKKNDRIKVLFPLNLIPERQMDFAFMELMSATSAACNNNFDSLMVPFRCVSTDIAHNKALIHRGGDLGEAIRASMTFPLVYKPIEINGSLQYDGGIVNNFPSDVMKSDFKPDIIIGHKVSDDGGVPDSEDLFAQIETLVMQMTNYYLADTVGILLETPLRDVALFDFQKVDYTNRRGMETALMFIDSIENKVERRVSAEELKARREAFKARKPNMIFNNIQVEGVPDNLQRKYIIQSVKGKERTIDIDQFRSAYFKIISDEHIKSIRPLAFYNPQSGLFDVHLKVEPRKPFDIEIGGMLSTRPISYSFFEANYKTFVNQSFTFSSNFFFGKFYNSFSIGGRMNTPTSLPVYISSYYTLNSWNYFSTSSDVLFADSNPAYVEQSERNLRVEVGTPFSRTGVIDGGFASSSSTDQYFQTNIFNRSDEFDRTTFNAISLFGRVDQKNYDFKQFATEGVRRFFELRYVYGNERFTPGTISPLPTKSTERHSFFQVKGMVDRYFILNDKWDLGLYAEGVVNNKQLFSNLTSTLLNAPAFMPTPNSKSLYLDQFRANQYFAIGGKGIYKFNDLFHFRGETYLFTPFRSIFAIEKNVPAYNEKIMSDVRVMGLAAFVYQTQLGPLSLEANYYERRGEKWFFSVNLGYMIFNKRGF